MKIALWQPDPVIAAPDAALRQRLDALGRMAAAAAAAGADLLLCPELYLTGYNNPGAIRALAEAPDGPANQAVAHIAATAGIALAYGFAEAEGARIFNTAKLITARGETLALYRKVHLYADYERSVFTPGTVLPAPVRFAGWQVGLQICYDIEFPEAARILALRGAELLLVPTALAVGQEAVPAYIIPARAVENSIFVAYCNFRGTDHGVQFTGRSCIAGPDGQKRAQAGTQAALIMAELDREAMAAVRVDAPYLLDRRAEVYQ